MFSLRSSSMCHYKRKPASTSFTILQHVVAFSGTQVKQLVSFLYMCDILKRWEVDEYNTCMKLACSARLYHEVIFLSTFIVFVENRLPRVSRPSCMDCPVSTAGADWIIATAVVLMTV